MVLFDFNKDSDLSNWYVIDDVVIGGRSDGSFEIDNEDRAVFFGSVSIENNGGFSSIRYNLDELKIKGLSYANICLKGAGKQYQFRIKSKISQRFCYTHTHI